jgi:hypothetical protein
MNAPMPDFTPKKDAADKAEAPLKRSNETRS